jgi:hypothetical protein
MQYNARHWALAAGTIYVVATCVVVLSGYLYWSIYRRTGRFDPWFGFALILLAVALFGVGYEARKQMHKAKERELENAKETHARNEDRA